MRPINLTGPQKDLLLWHWKLCINMNHVQELMPPRLYQVPGEPDISFPPIIPTKHTTTRTCQVPVCLSCKLSTLKTRTPKTHLYTPVESNQGVLKVNKYKPGVMVSSDQFVIATPLWVWPWKPQPRVQWWHNVHWKCFRLHSCFVSNLHGSRQNCDWKRTFWATPLESSWDHCQTLSQWQRRLRCCNFSWPLHRVWSISVFLWCRHQTSKCHCRMEHTNNLLLGANIDGSSYSSLGHWQSNQSLSLVIRSTACRLSIQLHPKCFERTFTPWDTDQDQVRSQRTSAIAHLGMSHFCSRSMSTGWKENP